MSSECTVTHWLGCDLSNAGFSPRLRPRSSWLRTTTSTAARRAASRMPRQPTTGRGTAYALMNLGPLPLSGACGAKSEQFPARALSPLLRRRRASVVCLMWRASYYGYSDAELWSGRASSFVPLDWGCDAEGGGGCISLRGTRAEGYPPRRSTRSSWLFLAMVPDSSALLELTARTDRLRVIKV